MYPGGHICELVLWNNPQLPENSVCVWRKCVCFPGVSHQLQHSEGAQLQDTIGKGEQQSTELEPIENAKKLDRQNGIIQSGIRAGGGGACISLKTPPW